MRELVYVQTYQGTIDTKYGIYLVNEIPDRRRANDKLFAHHVPSHLAVFFLYVSGGPGMNGSIVAPIEGLYLETERLYGDSNGNN